MTLIYKGKDRNRCINGRPLRHGEEITDPQLIKDLAGLPDFEGSQPPKAKKPKAEPKG